MPTYLDIYPDDTIRELEEENSLQDFSQRVVYTIIMTCLQDYTYISHS